MSTLVAQTISNGTVSTSSANVIQGSAKAWVNFNGNGSTTIRASYNISSVTYSSAGVYVINFTNAFSDTNYLTVCSAGVDRNGNSVTGWFGTDISASPSYSNKTTSAVQVASLSGTNSSLNTIDFNVACFR
jgi:hypothetical protein